MMEIRAQACVWGGGGGGGEGGGGRRRFCIDFSDKLEVDPYDSA